MSQSKDLSGTCFWICWANWLMVNSLLKDQISWRDTCTTQKLMLRCSQMMDGWRQVLVWWRWRNVYYWSCQRGEIESDLLMHCHHIDAGIFSSSNLRGFSWVFDCNCFAEPTNLICYKGTSCRCIILIVYVMNALGHMYCMTKSHDIHNSCSVLSYYP